MGSNPGFWTVFKADLLFSVCSITLTIIVTLVVAKWRKRKQKAAMAAMPFQKVEGPRIVVVGGKEPQPGHCPLCGQGWPLSGPAEETKL